jgi:hypothetical protein
MTSVYTNVIGQNLGQLEANVNASCASGEWRPIGGPYFHELTAHWVQALVRVAPPKSVPVKMKS